MLTLIGLGLFDEKDLTLRGVEAAKAADKIYLDFYTGLWNGNLNNLKKIIGKSIEPVSRKDLEENCKKIIEEAKKKKVAIFVQGDPLVATTHTALILEARKNKIKTKIIHNSSIISAIAETGLHAYRFGPTITIPFPEKTRGKPPESVYDAIKMSRACNLHTLCLMDLIAEKKKFMKPKEALEILLQLEDQRRENVFTEDTEIIILCKAGSDKPLIVYGKVKELMKKKFEIPAVLIIPGKLHFTEKEYLSLF